MDRRAGCGRPPPAGREAAGTLAPHAGEGRKLKALQGLVPEIGALEAEMQARSDEELRGLTAEFRRQIDAAGPDPVADREARVDMLDALLPEAFAAVREAGVRVLHDFRVPASGSGDGRRTSRR